MEVKEKNDELISNFTINGQRVKLQKDDHHLKILEINCSRYSAQLDLLARGEGQRYSEEMRSNLITGTSLKTNENCSRMCEITGSQVVDAQQQADKLLGLGRNRRQDLFVRGQ